jgi:two-component system NtrC family sensor kinase
MVATILIATLLLCMAWFFVARGVVGPLGALTRGAERIGHGDLAHRIDVRNRDEIGNLARTFNAMAERLAESQAHLEQRVEERTREFLRAARLADLGLLASGIAHEINTPLASISSCAEGLQRRLERGQVTPELLAEYAATIRAETVRASGITSRMLALVREQPSELGPVSMRLLVEQVRSAIQHRLEKRGVRLDCAVEDGDGGLHANGGELVQVLVNLVANAIDASPAGGRVELRARLQAGRLELEVEDEGVGIPPADQERIFDPFFTTKRPAEGTGLGLSLVASLVRARRGRIVLRSVVGKGTTFRVELPADWSEQT